MDKEKIKLIKILVKRENGKLSIKENIIILAQVKFKVDFQTKSFAYRKVKDNLDTLLSKNKNCKVLNSYPKSTDKNLILKIRKSRIADLNPKFKYFKILNFLRYLVICMEIMDTPL